MPTFAAICRADIGFDTLAVAILVVVLALAEALPAGTDLLVTALGAFRTATCPGILDTFTRFGIDVKPVNALNDFALALGACAILPSRDGMGAVTAMQTTVFNGIDFTGIVVDVHTIGAFPDRARCLNAIPG